MKKLSLVLSFCFLIVSICSGQDFEPTEKERQDIFQVFGKSESLEKEGKFSDAETELRQLTVKYPGHDIVWYVYGFNLWRQKKLNEAISAFKNSLAVKPDNGGPNLYLGFALMGKKNYEAAIPYLKKASEIHIQDFKKRNLPLGAFNQHLAEALFMSKKFEEARTEYEQLVATKPDHFPYLTRLVSCYVELNRLPEAENLLKHTVNNGIENYYVWKLYGDILAKRSKLTESEVAYAKAKTFLR